MLTTKAKKITKREAKREAEEIRGFIPILEAQVAQTNSGAETQKKIDWAYDRLNILTAIINK